MKNIGLVLAGGLGKGAYQIGALTAIGEYLSPEEISYVSASSIGALNAYAFLTDSISAMKNKWLSAVSGNNKVCMTRLLGEAFIRNAVSEIIVDKHFDNTFFISLLNTRHREISYVNINSVQPEKLSPYLCAAVTLPIYSNPVRIGDDSYYDGGIADNIPVFPLMKYSPDYVLCVYFDKHNYIFENECFDNRIVKLCFADDNLLSNSLILNSSSVEHMIQCGYETAKRLLDYVFTEGTDNIACIRNNIKYLNSISNDKKARLTVDIVVSNLNKLNSYWVKRNVIV